MNKKTVLILDDETVHIEVLFNIVQDFATVIFARSIEDANLLISSRVPDLILLDNQVRDGYGITYCSTLKSNPRTKHIPIIVVTASNDADTMMLAYEAGAIDFVTKPINSDILRLKILNVLQTIENGNLRFALPEVE